MTIVQPRSSRRMEVVRLVPSAVDDADEVADAADPLEDDADTDVLVPPLADVLLRTDVAPSGASTTDVITRPSAV